MSLRDALKSARENNPVYQNALLDSRIEQVREKEIATGWIPKLNATFDSRYNIKRQTLVLPAEIFGGSQAGFRAIQQGTPWLATPSVDLSLNFFDPGLMSDNRIQRNRKEMTDTDLLQAERDLKYNVTQAYYALLLAGEKLQEAEADLKRNEAYRKLVQSKFDNANALKTDLDQAVLNASISQTNLKKALNGVRSASASLWNAMGIPENAEITPTEDIEALVAHIRLSAPAGSAEEAFSRRMELTKEILNRRNAQLNLGKTKWAYAPTFKGYATLATQAFRDRFNFFDTGQQWYAYSYVGIQLTMPVFDGLQKYYVAKRQKMELGKTENNIRSLKASINYELSDSRIRLENALSSINDLKENMLLAEQLLKQIEAGYREGMRTNKDVLDAEFMLMQTKTDYLQGLYDLLMADLALQKAMGTL